jgi:hypothetical protein
MPRDDSRTSYQFGGRAVEIANSLGRINLDNLRDEIQETGAEAMWFGTLSAQARRVANEAKLDLDIFTAQLDQEYRRQSEARAVKATEDNIKSQVKLDPRYRTKYVEYLQAEEKASVVESAKFTIARKQSTLENLVGLLIAEEAATRPARRAM